MQAARGIIFSSKNSSARFPVSVRVFIEISNVGSNIRRRGRSFAASVPSDSSKPQRSLRRVPIHERRVMVESFVNKYRISNAGKFPTVSAAQKQVGGSYYVIRLILQEMEFKFKLSSVNKKDEVLLKETEKVVLQHFNAREGSQVSTTPKEVSNFAITDISTSPSPNLEVMENSSMKFINNPKMDKVLISRHDERVMIEKHDAKVNSPFGKSIMKCAETSRTKVQISDTRLETEVGGEGCHPRFVNNESFQDNVNSPRDQVIHSPPIGTHSHQIKLENGEVLQPPEEVKGSRKDGIAIKGSEVPKGESVLKNVQGPESEKFHGNTSKKSPSKEELSVERSNVWGNLKSLANGIIKLWRKM